MKLSYFVEAFWQPVAPLKGKINLISTQVYLESTVKIFYEINMSSS